MEKQRWLGALRVIGIDGGEADGSVVIDNECRWDGQFPALVAVDEWQVDEGTSIDVLLVFGNAIGDPELFRDLIPEVAQQREAQLVLVCHEERLLDGLRRDGDEKCSRAGDLRQDSV